MAQDLPLQSPMDQAVRRLEQALTTLESRVVARLERVAQDENGDLFVQAQASDDRARLVAELDAARAREQALEEVAAEASAALGRAAAEVRAALAAGEH
jgi:hypothetical protein